MEMKSFCQRRCIIIVYLLMPSVNLQIPMGPVGYPMSMSGPMFAMPAPPPMPIGVPVPIPMIIGAIGGNNNKRSTTTTTTESSKDVVQVPLPVEISIYPQIQNKYPRFYPAPFPGPPPAPFPPPGPFPAPYPPPGFGVPLPMPMMPPPPLVVVPVRQKKQPSGKKRRERKHDDYNDCDDCCGDRRRKCKYGYSKKRNFRRLLRSDEIDDNELVKPVLTYVSRNGDVKLRKRLSNDEAVDLMDDNKSFQKFSIVAGEDSESRPKLLVVSNNERESENRNHRRRQVVLRPGSSQHGLGEGRKELVFRPPGDKKISNLSVSFQISDR